MVLLGGGAVSYERGTPVVCRRRRIAGVEEEGRGVASVLHLEREGSLSLSLSSTSSLSLSRAHVLSLSYTLFP